METAADVIVHSTGSHFPEGEQAHLERVLAAFRLRVAGVNPRQKIERDRPWEFRSDAEAAFVCVVAAGDLLVSRAESFPAELRAGISDPGSRLCKRGDDLRSLFGNLFAVLFPGGGDSFEDFGEAGLAPAIFRRKISSADERFQLR